MVAALGKDRSLGLENKLLWNIPDDLKRFRELTTGHVLILGRKTFDSIIGYRGAPLPNRTNIVITRDLAWSYDGVLRASSVNEALEIARQLEHEEIFIGGGAQIYKEALPFTNRLYLTLIEDEKAGDVFFPEYEHEFVKEVAREDREWNGLRYSWLDLERN